MNRIYLNFLTILALNSVISLSGMAYTLDNKSGETIEFVEQWKGNVDEYVKTRSWSVLELKDERAIILPLFPTSQLAVRKMGDQFYDLNYLLQRISAQKGTHPNKMAAITFYKPSNPLHWSFDLEWR